MPAHRLRAPAPALLLGALVLAGCRLAVAGAAGAAGETDGKATSEGGTSMSRTKPTDEELRRRLTPMQPRAGPGPAHARRSGNLCTPNQPRADQNTRNISKLNS